MKFVATVVSLTSAFAVTLIILASLILSGCGAKRSDLNKLKDQITDQQRQLEIERSKNNTQDATLNDHENRIASLENSFVSLELDINEHSASLLAIQTDLADATGAMALLQSQLDDQDADIDVLQNDIADLQAQIDALDIQASTTDGTVTLIQQTMNTTQLQLTNLMLQLQGEDRVTSMIDVCGDAPGIYDEVLLKTSQGSIIAYFEQGNNRRLSVVPNGVFQVTDGSGCVFTVNNGNVTW
jgi:mannitol-specific phosphotransferase system IIBC component